MQTSPLKQRGSTPGRAARVMHALMSMEAAYLSIFEAKLYEYVCKLASFSSNFTLHLQKTAVKWS